MRPYRDEYILFRLKAINLIKERLPHYWDDVQNNVLNTNSVYNNTKVGFDILSIMIYPSYLENNSEIGKLLIQNNAPLFVTKDGHITIPVRTQIS